MPDNIAHLQKKFSHSSCKFLVYRIEPNSVNHKDLRFHIAESAKNIHQEYNKSIDMVLCLNNNIVMLGVYHSDTVKGMVMVRPIAAPPPGLPRPQGTQRMAGCFPAGKRNASLLASRVTRGVPDLESQISDSGSADEPAIIRNVTPDSDQGSGPAILNPTALPHARPPTRTPTADRRELAELLREQAALLDEADRTLLLLRIEDGRTLREIARLMQRNESTVARRIRRLIRRLTDPQISHTLQNARSLDGLEWEAARDYFLRGWSIRRISKAHNLSVYRVRAALDAVRKVTVQQSGQRR